MTNSDFKALVEKAAAAGYAAVDKLTVVPMVVERHADMLNDKSPVVERDFIADGVCGFAWVNVKPATSRFARYLKATKIGQTDGYYGGVTIWVSEFRQSLQKKEAYARAFAAVLVEAGFRAYASSRMD